MELGGRVFLVSLFLISGLGKIGGYEATMAYMSANGVPSTLLPVVIGFEVLAAVAVVAITGGFLLLVANRGRVVEYRSAQRQVGQRRGSWSCKTGGATLVR